MSSAVADLEPVTRNLCHSFMAAWEERMGHPIRVTQTLRTWDEQLHLWQQGRRLESGVWIVVGAKVTDAEPGHSPHNYGAAFDICFLGDDPYLHAYEAENHALDPLWDMVGECGTKVGLTWGGSWASRFKDRPHFERVDWRSLKAAA